MSQPTPTNREVSFGESDFIVSKTDTAGRVTYGNELFIQISGYSEEELLGAPHSILRHPDMPKTIFKLLWDTIKSGNEIFAFVKNMTKSGDYYWVKAQVTPSYDDRGTIIGYHSVRRKPSEAAKQLFGPLYKELLSVEQRGGMEAGVKMVNQLMNEKGVSYEEFVLSI